MSFNHSVVSIRKNLRTTPSEDPFAVLVEMNRGDKVFLVVIGKNPSAEGLSVIGQGMVNKSKELLIAELERAMKEKPAGKGVLGWLSESHRWSFHVSSPETVEQESDAPEVALEEAFKLFAHQVVKTDFMIQSLLQPSLTAPNSPLAIPRPDFAEAIPVPA